MKLREVFFSTPYHEQTSRIDSSGFTMDLKDIFSQNFHLIWGKYTATAEKEMALKFETPSVVSHYGLSSVYSSQGNRFNDGPAQYSKTYYQKEASNVYEVAMANHEYEFVEIMLSESFFERFLTGDSKFTLGLSESRYNHSAAKATYDAALTKEILSGILDMSGNVYSGPLQALYLEAKITELFLLQIKQVDQKATTGSSRLKPSDIDSLHDAKRYIEQHYTTPCSIIDLAKIIGINQMKLKNGFKELFGTTVFGYVRVLQMNKAKELLLEENLFVGEVADRLGYKHPHHFSTAFKRWFGILPSELKK